MDVVLESSHSYFDPRKTFVCRFKIEDMGVRKTVVSQVHNTRARKVKQVLKISRSVSVNVCKRMWLLTGCWLAVRL